MTRSGKDLPAPQVEETSDSLLERWLARAPASRTRIPARAAAPQPALEREPLGDELADRWFK